MTMEFNLKAKSSDGGFYQVVFKVKNELIRVKCDCVAGKFTQCCKHKLSFLRGEVSALFDPAQLPELEALSALLKQTGYPALLERLAEAENLLNEKKRLVKVLKGEIEMAMRKGA
jgi:hypothetical protein